MGKVTRLVLDGGLSSRFGYRDIISSLMQLDSKLSTRTDLVLCGSASVLLRQVDFRGTMDIDLCLGISEALLPFVGTRIGNLLLDGNAVGIIGLLIDCEDRLVDVQLPLHYLRVHCIACRDWVVFKLASPKVDDVLANPEVTLNDLLWVRDNMYNYGGINVERALSDLRYLIFRFEERG